MISLGKKNFRIKLGKENELMSNDAYKSPPQRGLDSTVNRLEDILNRFGNMFIAKMETLEEKITEAQQ